MTVVELLELAIHCADQFVMYALGASMVSFFASPLRPDNLFPASFVDLVVTTPFIVHVLAGAAGLVGPGILPVPAILCLRTNLTSRGTYSIFHAVWFAEILGALPCNYPAPARRVRSAQRHRLSTPLLKSTREHCRSNVPSTLAQWYKKSRAKGVATLLQALPDGRNTIDTFWQSGAGNYREYAY